jgi:hypothetical protein
MNYNGSFNPRFLSGTQLYFAKNTATVSSWNDQSPNGFNLSQGTALNQPTIGTNSVDFVPNQFMSRTVANAFSGHTIGSVFFSGYVATLGINQIYLSSADTSSVVRYLSFQVSTANQLLVQFYDGGTLNIIRGNTVLTAGNYFSAEFRQDGTGIRIFLNGVEESLTVTSGSNASNLWWNFPTSRDNLVIGALIRNTSAFGGAKINKIYYNNGSLSASDLWKVREFMKNPLNYD